MIGVGRQLFHILQRGVHAFAFVDRHAVLGQLALVAAIVNGDREARPQPADQLLSVHGSAAAWRGWRKYHSATAAAIIASSGSPFSGRQSIA